MPRNLLFLSLILSCALPAAAQEQGVFNAPGRYEIQSIASGQLLDVDTSDNQSVQQYARSDRSNQQWDIQPAGGGFFYIRSVGTDKVLSLAEGSSRNGTRVIVYRQHGGNDQFWQLQSVAPAQFQIVSRSGKVLDVPNGSRERGTRLQIWDSTGRASQLFRLVLVSGTWGGGWGGSAASPWSGQGAPRGWDRGQAARACRAEVSHHFNDLEMSEIAVEPSSQDADGNFIVRWRTSSGSSGFCRVDPSGQIVEFKVQESSP